MNVIYAQSTLKGIVRDKETGDSLLGAIIYFPDLKLSSLSKADGSFYINQLPRIKTLIQISLIGYQSYIQQIDLSKTDSFIVNLESAHIESNEVVVTGVSKATEMKLNPLPIVLIDSKYLQENSSTNIIEAMNKVAGIQSVNTGPNVSKPFIRGLGYNRILTLFDGVRQESQQWGDEHGIEMDQYLIDKIEIVKGPASLIYGSDALAGVVNLLPENNVPEGQIKGSVQSNYQSNNKLYALSANIIGTINKWQFGMRATQKAATDYKNKLDGRVYNTGFEEKNVNLHFGTTRRWGYSHVNASIYNNLQEIPDGSRDSMSRKFTQQITEIDSLRPIVSDSELNAYHIGPIHQKIQHYRVFSSSQFILKQSKLALKFGYQRSIRQEFSHPQYTNIAGLYLDMQTATYDAKLFLPETKGVETTMGINGFYQMNDATKGTEFVIPSYTQFDFGPFIHLKKSFQKIELAGGIRYDTRLFNQQQLYTYTNANGFETPTNEATGATLQFNNYQHQFQGISGSAGLTYSPSKKITLKANISRGYRAPNISEISAKGVHPGTGFQQLGDANFKPEFSLQQDVGFFFNNNHFSVSAEVFQNTISNYIFNQKLQSLVSGDSTYIEAGNNYPVYKFRQTTAQLLGGEAHIDIHPHPLDWLHVENSISLLYAYNRGGNGALINDSNKYLPFIPPFHTYSELRAEIKNTSTYVKHSYVKVGVNYFAAQNRILSADNTETKTPSYSLIEAGFGTELYSKKGKQLIKLGLFVTNIFDIAYQSNMSRLKYMDNYPINGSGRSGIYNMGRNWSLKITIPLSN